MADVEKRIVVDADEGIIEVHHLGLTLRTLLGAAASSRSTKNGRARSKFRLRYRHVIIGELRLRTVREDEEAEAPCPA